MAIHKETKQKLAEVESGPLWNDPKYFMPQETTTINEIDKFSTWLNHLSGPHSNPSSLLTDVLSTSSVPKTGNDKILKEFYKQQAEKERQRMLKKLESH